MDGVLADFFTAWYELVHVKHWKEIKDPNQAIQDIAEYQKSTGKNWWAGLKRLPNADNLIAAISKYGSYRILTKAPSSDSEHAVPAKKAWPKKHLKIQPIEIIVVTGSKDIYAKNSDGSSNILIDDFGKNIKSWRHAGGIAIKYEDRNAHESILELQQLMGKLGESKLIKAPNDSNIPHSMKAAKGKSKPSKSGSQKNINRGKLVGTC